MIKYSKTYSNIFKIKEDYLNFNDRELSLIKKINKYYVKQKLRKKCKICFKKLKQPTLKSFGVSYIFCNNCNHLNGIHEDTKNFHKFLYSGKTKNINFGKIYLKSSSVTPEFTKASVKLISITCGPAEIFCPKGIKTPFTSL